MLPEKLIKVLLVVSLVYMYTGALYGEDVFGQTPETAILAHFDKGLDADFAVGKKIAEVSGVTLAGEGKGLSGNCVEIPKMGYLAYSPEGGNFPLQDGTIELWFKPNWNFSEGDGPATDGQRYHCLFKVKGKPWARMSCCFDDYWNILNPRVDSMTPSPKEMSTAGTIPLKSGNWLYLAVTWKNFNGEPRTQEIRFYVNGVPKNPLSDLTVDFALDENSAIYIGGSPETPDDSWNGYIDELRISNKCFSQAEILEGYREGVKSLSGQDSTG